MQEVLSNEPDGTQCDRFAPVLCSFMIFLLLDAADYVEAALVLGIQILSAVGQSLWFIP